MLYVAESSPPLSLGQVARRAARRATRALLAGHVEPLTGVLVHELVGSGRWVLEVGAHLVEHGALHARRADARLAPLADTEGAGP